MNVTIRQIRYFVATAESGQVSRAAELCNITQSSITLAITRLEEELGQKLFVRQARGMLLTVQGEEFLHHCHAIMQTLDDAMEIKPEAPSELTATLRIGMTGTIAGYVFPPFWRRFRREYPHITLAIEEAEYTELETRLLDGDLDMVMMLISNIRRTEDCVYEKLLESPRRLWLSNSNPLINKEAISLRDLEDQDYIVPTMDQHESMIERYWQRHGFTPQILFRSYTLEALRSMVANDIGVSILSDMVYRAFSLEGRRIVRRDLAELPPSSDVGICWRKGTRQSHAGRTFLSMMRSETARMQGG
ncbi:LysR family transcriptional regulator [Arenibacterium sp. LLYu02]|uniref:LysR family transcriptional regulator n=1 Tax=Arenibacterium sp. LLYu02 TaxID=3404132 RepID=UPI003B216ED8